MKANLIDAMNGLRSLVGFYLTTLGLFGIALIVGLFKIIREARPEDLGALVIAVKDAGESIEVLGIVVYLESFSLLYGLLFLTFVAVLGARVRNLRLLYDHLAQSAPAEETAEVVEQMRLFPWGASPFHVARSGTMVFWTGLGIGLALLLWVIVFHIFLCPDDLSYPCCWFQAIGVVDAVLLPIVVVLLCRIRGDIRSVRRGLFA